jgi:predicted GTPase
VSHNVVIMGAAGRDFHLFNTCYRDQPGVKVVSFTATQIPHIDNRAYPAALAGKLYPEGIPIVAEEDLEGLLKDNDVDEVIFAYSDVSLEYVDQRRKLVESCGVKFSTYDVDATMLKSVKPVIAVCATRTGCGKSQTSRRVMDILKKAGKKVVVIRHPMPYGDLAAQAVQRFATMEDLNFHHCTIEEREEYEPHIQNGFVVYAGVDYQAILDQAEKEADVVVWDGGNNDTPFYKPDLWITVTDPHRAGHESKYFPGLENFKRANLIIINKIDSAKPEGIAAIEASAARLNPGAKLVKARSPLSVPSSDFIRGKKVLAVEDGPTLTHGGMQFGAAVVAANLYGAAELVDPRPWATGEIAETFEKYPAIGQLLPAMGYGEAQVHDLETTINAVECDLVLIGTPISLARIIDIDKPSLRVSYRLAEEGTELVEAVQHLAEMVKQECAA